MAQPRNSIGRAPLFDWPPSDDRGNIKPSWVHWFNAVSNILTQTVLTLVATSTTFPDVTELSPNTIIYVTDFDHHIFWDGLNLQFMGDPPGKIEAFLVNPGSGYQVCDGSVTSYLSISGLTVQAVIITVPDMISTGAYLKFGPVAANPVAATAPTLTMNSYTPAGIVSAPVLTLNPYTPIGTISVPLFLGNIQTFSTFQVAAGTDAFCMVGPNPYTPSGTLTTPIFTGTPAAPTGSVSTPAFTGTAHVLTGSISSTGQPRNIVLRPYFRR